MEPLHHFFHDHPLDLNHYAESAVIDGTICKCMGCWEDILGLSYCCKYWWCDFFLHKSCGKQPRELQHPLHPQHPLILLKTSPNHEQLCYFCNKYILLGFTYHCSHCNFNLHLKCASIPLTVKAKFHDHPLNLLRKSLSFTCDACGKKIKTCLTFVSHAHSCSTLNVLFCH